MGPVQVTAPHFDNLSKALRAAGGDLRRVYLASIRKATAPAKTAIPDSARAKLPRRGGANNYFADALKITTRTSLSGPTATVRIVASDPPHHDIRGLNRGVLRHPVYGNRDVWRNTKVTPWFFTEPCVALAPECRREIAAGTNKVLAEIARATL